MDAVLVVRRPDRRRRHLARRCAPRPGDVVNAWTLLLAGSVVAWIITIILGLIPEGEGRPLDLPHRAHLTDPQPQRRPYDWEAEA
jgi:hypothetical protein